MNKRVHDHFSFFFSITARLFSHPEANAVIWRDLDRVRRAVAQYVGNVAVLPVEPNAGALHIKISGPRCS